MTLEIELDREQFRPGELVTGRVHVAAGGNSRALEVMLQFVEESPDYRVIARSAGPQTLHRGELHPGQLIDFALELPADALPSTGSDHGELCWEVVARSEELGLDTRASAAIEVLADRSPTRLTGGGARRAPC